MRGIFLIGLLPLIYPLSHKAGPLKLTKWCQTIWIWTQFVLPSGHYTGHWDYTGQTPKCHLEARASANIIVALFLHTLQTLSQCAYICKFMATLLDEASSLGVLFYFSYIIIHLLLLLHRREMIKRWCPHWGIAIKRESTCGQSDSQQANADNAFSTLQQVCASGSSSFYDMDWDRPVPTGKGIRFWASNRPVGHTTIAFDWFHRLPLCLYCNLVQFCCKFRSHRVPTMCE